MNRTASSHEDNRYDPVLLHSRRETLVILVAFVLCLVWSVTWCYLAGYNQPADGQIAKVMGIPSWVFWGVLVPWLAADVFTLWFCFFFVADDPLGEEKEVTEEEANATGLSDNKSGG